MVLTKIRNQKTERDRKPNRLKHFDYSTEGAYFVTICTANRENIFGEIQNREMVLNDLGKIAEKCWREIPTHFPHARADEFVVMPNHVHGIVRIENNDKSVRVGNENFHSLQLPNRGAKSRSLPSIIRGFKIGVTKWCHQNSAIYSVWQKSFHDRIIRDDAEMIRIREYILLNPQNWENDKNNF